MLLTLVCSCAHIDSPRRVTTATYDAVDLCGMIPVKTIKEIETGIVEYTINTIRTNNPNAYTALSDSRRLDLTSYKRQYYPALNGGNPDEEIRVVNITLISDDFIAGFDWLHVPFIASDGWIGIIYVRYDLKEKKFLSAHTGAIS